MDEINTTVLYKQALEEISKAGTLVQVNDLRVKYLGKKGIFTLQLKKIGTLDKHLRREAGALTNKIKNDFSDALLEKKNKLDAYAADENLLTDSIDVTLPGRGSRIGSVHPISRTIERIEKIFTNIGFDIATGPEIEEDYYNFQALNFPEDHPARAMQDTFYVDDKTVLRTHTSNVQIRYMLDQKPPLRTIAPGRVYRCDTIDLTHTPMFHQIEGLAIDETTTFAHLKGVLNYFANEFFEQNLNTRFRPSFFPFTEPSAEVDISCVFCAGSGCRVCARSGWLEIGGCGMVHPNVLANVNIDTEKYSGYAFGMGIERMAMLRYGINDLRLLFENDLSFLNQFNSI